MVQVLEKSINDKQFHKALTLYERFEQNGDLERAEKAAKLLKKMHEQEFITAFSGHFSAGKSTMINTLIGEQILPSSPIPTSANLVKVHDATEEFAKVYYQNEKPLLFHAPYDFETVKEYCKNGDVVEIEIGKVSSKLPPGITVMDTPGVDSTDDAHRVSTESALHLADIVFYVMDYNHVQSELNFIYTKNLLQHGVKLYLIINQIDKHNEAELTFEQFKRSVHEAFAAWDVHPEEIYFTTLKNPNFKHNEFVSVKALIHDAINNHQEWMMNTVEAAFRQLIEEHNEWLESEKAIAGQSNLDLLGNLSEAEYFQFMSNVKGLEAKSEKILQRHECWIRSFEEERAALLKSAYLMPYEIRELAEKFLEAAQPDFKVGFFSSKKKTENERTVRLEAFAEKVRHQVQSQLEWHLRELLAKKLLESEVANSELEAAVQKLAIDFENQLLVNIINKGARVTGEYVLNYCEELANQLKRTAITTSDQLKERVAQMIEDKGKKEVALIQSELNELKKITAAIKEIESLEREYAEKVQLVEQSTGNEEKTFEAFEQQWEQLKSDVNVFSEGDQLKNEAEEQKLPDEVKVSLTEEEHQSASPQAMIQMLEKAFSYFSKEKGFERIAEQLMQKASRLKDKEYTIALFGAFSAGKSSFANAMLGEQVLPVSPNPTTAAINRICPPTHEFEHGTAVVRLKEEKNMLADVKQSLQMFGKDCSTLEEAKQLIPAVLLQKETEGKEKVHLSFLIAFNEGFEEFSHQLGQSIVTNIQDFQGYVAIESQSCFVESIDLYYDCPFTRNGVTLVDTPGADSINARHTGVAFDYIKNSDAILFVTYYNHAFSKADREFLIQLGRVKDAFELDKMFFIVNAIDLASSEEEINEVLTYVKSQLSEYGIRFPRVFGLSSKLAQSAQTKEKSNIEKFTSAFSDFLEHDLAKMAVQSAESDYHRAVTMLDQMIASASEDESKKAQRKLELHESQNELIQWLEKESLGAMPDRLSQEGKELVHYVKQRVFFRLPDFFKEAFNPAILQTNSRHLLNRALDDYLAATGFDFAQELRATSLRMEKFVERLLKDRFEQLKKEIGTMESNMMMSNMEIGKSATIEFVPAFEDCDRKPFESTFKFFKNPKSFFEKNEKKLMEESLAELLSPLADYYLEQGLLKIEEQYQQMLADEFSHILNRMKEDIIEQYKAWLLAFEDTDKLAHWESIRKDLASIEQ